MSPEAAAAPTPPASNAASASASAGADGAVAHAAKRRAGLGTAFGEAVSSPIEEVAFVRANASHPSVIVGVRYNDHDGLLAMGIDVDHLTCGYPGCDPGIGVAPNRTAIPGRRSPLCGCCR
jgi:hypothetical protein